MAPITHPCFTNGETYRYSIHSDELLVVFCDASRISREHTRFVGIVASDPTFHGSYGHIAVQISGAVTMACDLQKLQAALPMDPLAFEAPPPPGELPQPGCFVGLPPDFLPPFIVPASARRSWSYIGQLLQTGRSPSNEVRILLSAGQSYTRTARETLERAADPVRGLTLDEVVRVLGDDAADAVADLADMVADKFQDDDGRLNKDALAALL